MILPPGGFLTLGALLTCFAWISGATARRARRRGRRDGELLLIFASACVINNFTLAYFLGLCPFFGVTGRLRHGVSARAGQHLRDAHHVARLPGSSNSFVLPHAPYLRLITFIVVIASTVQFVEMVDQEAEPGAVPRAGHLPAADHHQLRHPRAGAVPDQQGLRTSCRAWSTPWAPAPADAGAGDHGRAARGARAGARPDWSAAPR